MAVTRRGALAFALIAGAVGAAQAQAPRQDKPARPRPVVSADVAQRFAIAEVLKTTGRAGSEITDPWNPLADPLVQNKPFKADYTVATTGKPDGIKSFTSVQQAVNRAVLDAAAQPNGKRQYILVKPGTYREIVYIPASARPITLYGEGKAAQDTVISAGLDAAVPVADYVKGYGAQFERLDPSIRDMHAVITARAPTISTSGTMTVWVRNPGFQARNLTIENSYNKATGNGRDECSENRDSPACTIAPGGASVARVSHQAVALTVEGADKAQFENIRLIGFQDTLYLKSAETRVTARSFFHKSYIEGDIDFIFGDTTAYFYRSEVRSLGDRTMSFVGAPNTNWKTKYGFVFNEVHFTSDGRNHSLAGKFHLARQWFHNSRCSPYAPVNVPGYACTLGETSVFNAPKGTITPTVLETVGKMAVLNSRIGRHIDRNDVWTDWNAPGMLSYRPAQFDSNDFYTNLKNAGFDPVNALGYGKQPLPAEIYLAEFNNADE
ncbi:pectinesterase [Pseudoduganella lurida]|uniref:Pectinesterase n=1 Tax=Pseudoduganella lurida TaxID=1036180 RepID=A0A562R5A5_9BURK|nr:pectinesterase family protein [Pseudoduganella lurida]TWI64249.1 pectinesterase [Pseudoduganella lurida]